MAQTLLQLEIRDGINAVAKRQQLADDFALVYNYPTLVPSAANPDLLIPNPETKAQHAKRQIIEFIRDVHRQARIQLDLEAARGTIIQQADVDNQELLT